tara:strand:+ start:19 stop:624 length:606 start_codon:yes stop_codon:yes gene_type:complete
MAVISNGTTVIDAGAISGGSGSLVLIKTLNVTSSTSSVNFIHGSSSVVFNDTYDEYIIKMTNIHPSNDGVNFSYDFGTGGAATGATKTTTAWGTANEGTFAYDGGKDLAQASGIIKLDPQGDTGNDAAQCGAGFLHIFNPGSGSVVKNFYTRFTNDQSGNYTMDHFTAGYVNTTTALSGVSFEFSAGTLDNAIIKLYGVDS